MAAFPPLGLFLFIYCYSSLLLPLRRISVAYARLCVLGGLREGVAAPGGDLAPTCCFWRGTWARLR